MDEDGPADDGQIRVGPDEVVGKLVEKGGQPPERHGRDAHRDVVPVQHDAVLVVVHVGRILEIPRFAAQLQRNEPVVLPRGMVDPPRVAGIFRAEHAFRIGDRRRVPQHGDFMRVLLRLGQVDGDLQLAVFRFRQPVFVSGHALDHDVVGRDGLPVEKIRGGLDGRFPGDPPKFAVRFRRPGHEKPHDPGIEQIPVRGGVFREKPDFVRKVEKPLQNGRRASVRHVRHQRLRIRFRRFRQPEQVEQGVAGRDDVFPFEKAGFQREGEQPFQLEGEIGGRRPPAAGPHPADGGRKGAGCGKTGCRRTRYACRRNRLTGRCRHLAAGWRRNRLTGRCRRLAAGWRRSLLHARRSFLVRHRRDAPSFPITVSRHSRSDGSRAISRRR